MRSAIGGSHHDKAAIGDGWPLAAWAGRGGESTAHEQTRGAGAQDCGPPAQPPEKTGESITRSPGSSRSSASTAQPLRAMTIGSA